MNKMLMYNVKINLSVNLSVKKEQKRALKIIYPQLRYEEALNRADLMSLQLRREEACIKFLEQSRSSFPLLSSLAQPNIQTRPYALRSGQSVSVPVTANTKRFGSFITVKYQKQM